MEVIDAAGELRSFRTLQQQPAQRDRPIEAQLHRFMGSKGGRKVRYARLLVDALDLAAVPRSLDAVLTNVCVAAPHPPPRSGRTKLMPELQEASYRIRPPDTSPPDAFDALVERHTGINGRCWCLRLT